MNMDGLEDAFDDDLNLDDPIENNPIDATIPVDDSNIFDDDVETFELNTPSIIDEFLTANGISNNIIKYTDENDEEKEVNFYDLSKEDQLEILNSFNENTQDEIPEKEFLDYLKTNNLTVDNFLLQYKDNIIKELGVQPEVNYEIDSYEDQELFLLDLKSKYDLTDEELASELEKELLNETLFKKKVDSLRSEYKKLEDQYKETQKLEADKQKEEEFNAFADTLVNIAVTNSDFYGIELEDSEKNEVLSFLLDLDDNGASNFYKELNKPEKLYEAAWFLKFGKEAFDALRSAYESEITKLKKDNKNQVVIRDTKQNKVGSIHDLI